MRVFRTMALAGALLAVVGCQNTYKQTSANPAGTAAPLNANSRVYVAMPDDGVDKKEPIPDSGRHTALALQDALKRQTHYVAIGKYPESVAEAINHARELSYEYVAFPTILKWEDRQTEWSGVRDKLQLKIDLVAVDSGQVAHSTTIEAKSKWMTDGGETPKDLLAEPVDKFVRSLFRRTYTPTALQK